MIVIVSKAANVMKSIRRKFRSRVLEWEHAIMTTLWGLVVLCNPGVFNGPSFVAFVGSPVVWGWLVLCLGVLNLVALGVNGYMARPTAMIRVVGALTRIGLYGAISLGFLFSWAWPTALAVYPVIGFFGLFSLYWAIFDVAIPDEHNA